MPLFSILSCITSNPFLCSCSSLRSVQITFLFFISLLLVVFVLLKNVNVCTFFLFKCLLRLSLFNYYFKRWRNTAWLCSEGEKSPHISNQICVSAFPPLSRQSSFPFPSSLTKAPGLSRALSTLCRPMWGTNGSWRMPCRGSKLRGSPTTPVALSWHLHSLHR